MVDGISQMTRHLAKVVPERVKRAARDAMEKGAEETVAMMKRLAPVDDGDLQMSISWTWGKPPKGSKVIAKGAIDDDPNAPAITIYAGNDRAYYAAFQELGTVAMQANPFFFPSWRANRQRVRSRITREISKAIKASSA